MRLRTIESTSNGGMPKRNTALRNNHALPNRGRDKGHKRLVPPLAHKLAE